MPTKSEATSSGPTPPQDGIKILTIGEPTGKGKKLIKKGRKSFGGAL